MVPANKPDLIRLNPRFELRTMTLTTLARLSGDPA
jgi:hypothetical protein